MEFMTVTSEGDVILLYPDFFKLIIDTYIVSGSDSIEKVAAWRPYILHQDTQNRGSQTWPWENFYDHIPPNTWPLNLPIYCLLEYYERSSDEWETNKTPWNIRGELQKG